MNSKDHAGAKEKYTKLSIQQQLAIKGGRMPDDKPKRPKMLRPRG